MKYASSRYALTAGLGSLTSSCVMLALEQLGLVRFGIAVLCAGAVGLICYAVIPYHDRGDN